MRKQLQSNLTNKSTSSDIIIIIIIESIDPFIHLFWCSENWIKKHVFPYLRCLAEREILRSLNLYIYKQIRRLDFKCLSYTYILCCWQRSGCFSQYVFKFKFIFYVFSLGRFRHCLTCLWSTYDAVMFNSIHHIVNMNECVVVCRDIWFLNEFQLNLNLWKWLDKTPRETLPHWININRWIKYYYVVFDANNKKMLF